MKRSSQFLLLAIAATGLLAGCDDRPKNDGRVLNERVVEGSGGTKVIAEIWVDNWFSLAINGKPLIEDSVPYKTERSFNAERVTFNTDFPMTIAFEFRDYVENDTGLEYIGTNRQQIGDGGAIAQFTNAKTGAIIKVTDASWKCHVIHHAPVDAALAPKNVIPRWALAVVAQISSKLPPVGRMLASTTVNGRSLRNIQLPRWGPKVGITRSNGSKARS